MRKNGSDKNWAHTSRHPPLKAIENSLEARRTGQKTRASYICVCLGLPPDTIFRTQRIQPSPQRPAPQRPRLCQSFVIL